MTDRTDAALPTISINTLCLGPGALSAHVDTVARLGATAFSPDLQDFEACAPGEAIRLFRNAGLTVAALTHRAFGFTTPEIARAQRERLFRTIDLAHAIGAQAICMTTGGRGELSWRDAASRFTTEIAPCADRARAAGISLSIEPTSHLYADASLTHRLTDTVALARTAGIHVAIDLFACWADSDIESAIDAAGSLTSLVQISDYVPGDRALPCRAVPGDGAAQLSRLVPLILASGYRGPFDIEIIGPRLAAEGVEAGLARAIANVSAMLAGGAQQRQDRR